MTRECHAGILREPGGEIPPGHPTERVFRESKSLRFSFIRGMERENEGLPRGVRFPVDFMCRMLGVSRAGYYAWRNRGPSAHAVRDAELTEKILEVDEEHKHRCGIERILWELQEDGLWTSQRRVRRLARAAGVECVHPRPYVRTTLPDAQARDGLADLVDRDFRPAAADQLWVGDITCIHTFSGFAYLATVIDLFSNKVIGWMVADHMRTDLVLDALDMALAARRPGIGEAVMHTDRGTQGEFKRSSQHLDLEVYVWDATRMGSSCNGAAGDAFAGAASGGRREDLQRFWVAIARGMPSEDAGIEAGVSPVVGTRWFREAVGSGRSAWRRCRGGTCRWRSGRRSRSRAPGGAVSGRSPGVPPGRRRRSRGSCAATRRPGAAGWSTGPRRPVAR